MRTEMRENLAHFPPPLCDAVGRVVVVVVVFERRLWPMMKNMRVRLRTWFYMRNVRCKYVHSAEVFGPVACPANIHMRTQNKYTSTRVATEAATAAAAV